MIHTQVQQNAFLLHALNFTTYIDMKLYVKFAAKKLHSILVPAFCIKLFLAKILLIIFKRTKSVRFELFAFTLVFPYSHAQADFIKTQKVQ